MEVNRMRNGFFSEMSTSIDGCESVELCAEGLTFTKELFIERVLKNHRLQK